MNSRLPLQLKSMALRSLEWTIILFLLAVAAAVPVGAMLDLL